MEILDFWVDELNRAAVVQLNGINAHYSVRATLVLALALLARPLPCELRRLVCALLAQSQWWATA